MQNPIENGWCTMALLWGFINKKIDYNALQKEIQSVCIVTHINMKSAMTLPLPFLLFIGWIGRPELRSNIPETDVNAQLLNR